MKLLNDYLLAFLGSTTSSYYRTLSLPSTGTPRFVVVGSGIITSDAVFVECARRLGKTPLCFHEWMEMRTLLYTYCEQARVPRSSTFLRDSKFEILDGSIYSFDASVLK